MALQARDVCLEILLPFVLGLRVDIVHEGRERYFRVDDDFAPLVQVQDDVRAQEAPFVRFHRLSLGVAYHCLCVIVYAARQSLCFQQFVQYGFAPVSLHLAAMFEYPRQLFRAFLCGLALAHHVLDGGSHLTAHGGLLQRVVLHGLLHLVDGFAQGGDYLSQVGVALFGKLLLALLQHFVCGRLHLHCHHLHRFVEAFFLSGQPFPGYLVPFFPGFLQAVFGLRLE